MSGRLKTRQDSVIAAAVHYEDAALRLLQALGSDEDDFATISACKECLDALDVIRAMTEKDREHSFLILLERGRIPSDAWDLIAASVKVFAGATRSPGHVWRVIH